MDNYRTCSENISTTIASGGELSVITRSTIYSVGFGTKLFVHNISKENSPDDLDSAVSEHG